MKITSPTGASVQGTRHGNHDVWGHAADIVWVIDGATSSSPLKQGLSASDYAQALDHALKETTSLRPDLALPELLEEAIARVSSTAAGRSGHSATIALCRLTPGGVDWLVLGDSAVLIDDGHSVTLMQDNRLQSVSPELRQLKRTLVKEGAPDEEVRDVVRQIRTQEERFRNRAGGFWVAASDPQAAREALHGRSAGTSAVVLMTDGVTDGLEHEFWSTPRSLLSDLRASGPETTLARLHTWLEDRHLPVDDMTAALVA